MKALRIFTSLTIGLAAGLAAGYLTAPRSGRKTRKMLSTEMDNQMKSLEKNMNHKLSDAKKEYDKQLHKLADSSKAALHRVKEMASSN